jgi:uncharacterized protein YcbX
MAKDLRLSLDASSSGGLRTTVSLFGMGGEVAEEAEEASRWFSEYLEMDAMLCRDVSNRFPRESPRHYTATVGSERIALHDFAALHIICEDGVAWLRQNVSDGSPVTTAQFRANIVVRGIPFPEEDRWSELTIGTIPMRVAKQSGRCVIPTHDSDGRRNPNFEPTATLRRLRAAHHRHQRDTPGNAPCYMFGVDAFHMKYPARIAVGDRLTVTQSQDPPIYASYPSHLISHPYAEIESKKNPPFPLRL